MAGFQISKKEAIEKLNKCLNKTLGDVDCNHVFDEALRNPFIKGIAGDVIEQSVFGMPKDSEQKPDLIVDSIPTELKTTGAKYKGTKNNKYLGAKEPITITNVSPNKLVNENWENSAFLHKIDNILFVFYFYSSNKVVPSFDYRLFKIIGYNFFKFNKDEIDTLKNDWKIVQKRAQEIKANSSNAKLKSSDYGSLTKCRHQTMMINMSSPTSLRFRLNTKVGDMIVERCLKNDIYSLPESITSYDELTLKLKSLTALYKNKKVSYLIDHFSLSNINLKAIGEAVISKMFGASTIKMNKIDLFLRSGLIGKTIVLTKAGLRTEDMKLFPIDFDEIMNLNISWEDTSFRNYFSENRFLCIIFEEPSNNAQLKENEFKGFKIYSFSDEFIDNECKHLFERIRNLIINNQLVDVVCYDKNGLPIINKTGVVKSAPNFPKSKDSPVFVRGDSSDSTRKPLCINGINMYNQYIWIKGKYIVDQLKEIEII